jgi:hypothetical protein
MKRLSSKADGTRRTSEETTFFKAFLDFFAAHLSKAGGRLEFSI